MKKNRIMLAFAVCVAMATVFMLAGCGGSSEEATEETTAAPEAAVTFEEADVPEQVMKIVDTAMGVAEKYAGELTPEWGDQYVVLMESGEARDYKDYDAIKGKLDEILKESGATYVYTLSPVKDGKPAIDGETGKGAPFMITVDAGDDPDDWATEYEWELQFTEAWDGSTASARSAWADNDEGTELCWSAFAPVKDSNGNVVCILGVDYPANEILKFPEWNRDAKEWNGIEE